MAPKIKRFTDIMSRCVASFAMLFIALETLRAISVGKTFYFIQFKKRFASVWNQWDYGFPKCRKIMRLK